MITAAALGSPATAQAWPWDPTVTVKGNDGCTLAQTGWIYAVASNGEVHYGTSGWGGAYSMTFGRVPSGGESIRFEVHCSMTGVHTTYRWISRPGWGTTVTTNI